MCPKHRTEEQRKSDNISNLKNHYRRLCLKHQLDEYYTPRPEHGFTVTFRAEYLCKYGHFHERLTYKIMRTDDTNEVARLDSVEDVSSQYERTIF